VEAEEFESLASLAWVDGPVLAGLSSRPGSGRERPRRRKRGLGLPRGCGRSRPDRSA